MVTQGDTYPAGPWRSETSAQRGSVEYIFEYPGDPQTPGTPSIAGAARIRTEDATNLPRIPVQPISYGDARQLLEGLRGSARPRGFQGGLPFAYHVGGTDDVRVRLKTDMDYQVRPIWNVIARIEGQEERDRWVILGNHHDAWTFGAVDPNSGTTAMLEVARGLGQLVKEGWRPRRTIMLCSWDAEEYGLIGSTEWVEENAAELRAKAVAYLNMDVAVSGPNFNSSAVPPLWRLVRGAARDVRDPKTGRSVYDLWQQRTREETGSGAETAQASSIRRGASESGDDVSREATEPALGALGSGSDYTPFLQHLGIPSLDMSFSGDYGVYHSAYDSFHWMEKFGDPTFAYHVAAAQLWGTVALRLAQANVLPFHYTDYANQIGDFVNETLKTDLQRNITNSFEAQSMLMAAKELGDEATRVEQQRNRILEDLDAMAPLGRVDNASGRTVTATTLATRLKRINDSLVAAEQALTDRRGLRGRTWYKHQIYAPGFYTGYTAQPLPDLRQAIEERDAAAASEAATRITEAIRRATEVFRKTRD